MSYGMWSDGWSRQLLRGSPDCPFLKPPKIMVGRHEATFAVINPRLCAQGGSELSHFFLGC